MKKTMFSARFCRVGLFLGGLALALAACQKAQEHPAPATQSPTPAPPAPRKQSAALLTPQTSPKPQPAPRTGDKLTTEGIRQHLGQPGVVTISWTTESELNSFGFNIMRSKTEKAPGEKVNNNPIQGAGVSSTHQEYVFYDTDVKIGDVWYYHAQQIDLDGTSREYSDWTARIVVNRMNMDKVTTGTMAR